MEKYINKQVIVRASRAGVFFGTLAEKEGNEVKLNNCRRLWYWEGAASLSELATNGVTQPHKCKFCVPIPDIVVLGVIEIIPCTEEAVENINNVPVWKMSK
jgi:hypothetical protein